MKESAHEVLEELNKLDDPLLKVAIELEKIAFKDEYFIEKKLFPNVDFYSGIILKALGLSNKYVYSFICNWKNCWLDFSMERNDRRSNK